MVGAVLCAMLPLVLTVFTGAARAEEDAAKLLERVMKVVGRPIGLAHLPRCNDPDLPLELARTGHWTYVHAQNADAATIQRVNEAADEAGLLNRRVSVDIGGLERLMPVGRSCDLVLLTDLGADELSPRLAAEIRRVLHPWYGIAVLGDSTGALDTAALARWARTIADDVSALPGAGSLVVATAGPLEGADDWTHWWHGPDNNAVSTDTAFRLPETLQWSGKPFFSTRLELPVIAGGRLFMLWNGHIFDSTPGEAVLPGEEVVLRTHGWDTILNGPVADHRGPLLTAQAVGSGRKLWTRRLSGAAWMQVSRSILVADDSSLLMADGARLLELDAATGAEKRTRELGCEEIKWMAADAGMVFVLGGPVTEYVGRRSGDAVVPFRRSGRMLLALDRDSLEPLWRVERDEEDAFDPRSPAVAGGNIYLCTEKDVAEKRSTTDGSLVWQVETGFERMAPQGYEWDRSSRHPVTGYASLGVYVISGTEMSEAIVLSQQDGSRIWTAPTPKHHQFMPLAFENLLWSGGDGLNPLTGSREKQLPGIQLAGCSRFTASPAGIMGNAGITYDLLGEHPVAPLSAKSSCLAGQLVANGLQWKFPTPCTNCTEWRGFIARAAREELPVVGRLWQAAETAPSVDTDPAGWLTHRGRNDRSSSTPADLPQTVHTAWTAEPVHGSQPVAPGNAVLLGAEIVPTPPVIAGDTVVVANGDGAVDALDLATGRPLWRALTGGRISSSPSVWRDRVFVGSADGHVYAFALSDGRLLWRLRVAPQAGRAMVYDQLGSRWPVLCNPIVAGDRVFAVAGLLDQVDGVHAIAADAGTGAILWEKNDWKDAEVAGMISAAGQFCVDGQDLVYHGAESPVVRLSMEDGRARPVVAQGHIEDLTTWDNRKWQTVKAFNSTYKGAKGQEVGSIAPGWLVWGGRRLLTDQRESGTWRQVLGLLVPDEAGDGRLPVLQITGSERMPCWDDRDVLFTGIMEQRHISGLIAAEPAAFQAAARASMPDLTTEAILAKDAKAERGMSIPPPEIVRPLAESGERWRRAFAYGWSAVSTVLARNAVLTAQSGREAFMLAAYNRTDGTERWSVQLPDAVVHNGLAVAADGRIVAALRDGRILCIAEEEATE